MALISYLLLSLVTCRLPAISHQHVDVMNFVQLIQATVCVLSRTRPIVYCYGCGVSGYTSCPCLALCWLIFQFPSLVISWITFWPALLHLLRCYLLVTQLVVWEETLQRREESLSPFYETQASEEATDVSLSQSLAHSTTISFCLSTFLTLSLLAVSLTDDFTSLICYLKASNVRLFLVLWQCRCGE